MRSPLAFIRGLGLRSDAVFLVGGAVRDYLIGKESLDLDLIAVLPHEDLVKRGFRLIESQSTPNIYFKHDLEYGKIEVTRLDTMAEVNDDLARRDFTINTMIVDLLGGPLGTLQGKKDIEARLLRACSDRSFLDDPLRIFRGFRFESDGWQMTPETESLIRTRDWSDVFRTMPIERFTNEMMKALARKTPESFFERMIEFNVGMEFLPELFRMPHIPAGPLEHHPEGDLLTHSIQVLQRVAAVSEDPLARFCAFFHDLGKLATDPALYPKHHGHDDAGFEMAEEFCNRLHLPVTYRKALAWVSRLHGKANKWDELRDSTKIRIAEQTIKAGIVEILPLVSAADKPGNQKIAGWEDSVRVAGMNTRELGIDQEKLEAMLIDNRPSYILQKRVEALMKTLSICLMLILLVVISAYSNAFAIEIVTIGTATPGGGFPVYGDVVAKTVNSSDAGLQIKTVNTKGSNENVPLLESGKLDIALVQGEVAYDVFYGSNSKKAPLKIIAAMYATPGMFVVRGDSPYRTITHLKGKKIAFGARGSGLVVLADYVLKGIGLDQNKDFIPVYLERAGDGPVMVIDGSVTALWGGGVGWPGFNAVAKSAKGAYFITPNADEIRSIITRYPFLKSMTHLLQLIFESYLISACYSRLFCQWHYSACSLKLESNLFYSVATQL